MNANIVKFTLRSEINLMKRFCYVAKYNGRSANRELGILMKKHVMKYEKRFGKIELEK